MRSGGPQPCAKCKRADCSECTGRGVDGTMTIPCPCQEAGHGAR